MEHQSTQLNLLIVEDNLGDFVLIENYLIEEHPQINLSRAANLKEVRQKLGTIPSAYDAILLDLSLPDSNDSTKLVKEVVSLAGRSAVIVLTGFSNKEFGVKTLSLGISDYLYKDELNAIQLSKSLQYSLERKKIQNQLVESEKKYKSLFNNSPQPMWVLDRDSLCFLSVNEAAVQLYGYTREEFLNMTVRDLWGKAEEPEIEEVLVRERNGYFKINITHLKKSGEQIVLEIQSNPIIFDGIPARVSLVNNITARLKAEEALILSEQRFRALVQNGSDLVMIIDCEGNFTYVSPSAKAVTGTSCSSLLKENFYSMIHKEDLGMVRSQLQKLHERKNLQIPSYRIKTAKGDWRWIETIFTNLTLDPAVKGIVVNSRDITDFVIQERKLRESLNRYDIMAKATSDTITDYDIKNDVMHYNEGIENIFGFKGSEIEPTAAWWNEKIHPEDRERLKRKIAEVYREDRPQIQIEYRFRCADGSYKYVLDRSYLVKDEQERPVRIIGSMQDISRTREYIQTIEQNNARLKDIAWTQSHVVRAPLARIMGIIDLLQCDGKVESQDELLENIVSSAKELDGIIRKINSKAEQATLNRIEC